MVNSEKAGVERLGSIWQNDDVVKTLVFSHIVSAPFCPSLTLLANVFFCQQFQDEDAESYLAAVRGPAGAAQQGSGSHIQHEPAGAGVQGSGTRHRKVAAAGRTGQEEVPVGRRGPVAVRKVAVADNHRILGCMPFD